MEGPIPSTPPGTGHTAHGDRRMTSIARPRGGAQKKKREDEGGWASAFAIFSSDSDSDDESDTSDSDVSDDDLKGGGKHRKRRRQNNWRCLLVCGLLFLGFVFYEEIVDAAAEVKSIKQAWVQDLREGTVSPRRALDKPGDIPGGASLLATTTEVPPDDPTLLNEVTDPVFKAKLEARLNFMREEMERAGQRHVDESRSHGETKEQLRVAQEKIAQLEKNNGAAVAAAETTTTTTGGVGGEGQAPAPGVTR